MLFLVACFSRHGGPDACFGAEMFVAMWLLCFLRCVISFTAGGLSWGRIV